MAKTIQVNLQFNANTANAKSAVQQLQNQLTTLSQQSTLSNPLGITPQLQQAEQSAMRLKIALNNAFNQDTGKLNLNKFQAELKSSGMSLKTLAADMRALGPAGIQAFSQLTQQIVAADTRMFSLQGKAKTLVDQFGSAMKWTIAYGAINKMTQSISNAVSYVKELDTSLNNIRIVTGKSAEQMESFAKTANNMAKSLSTTTKTYSDASLIYYQQGLNDSEVKKRTDVTVKLANATGESAQQVSEWMTAIWNNFDDGSEKLDYYADVLAKLGATTASSADEIATGLEKFSAVADTVGLSYEYAASALATITAETRQSADVVGTSLKTLFARMEGLKFGDTLEDGTTLNQYSLALQKVGVDIKDANGELKDMDIILDQTGARWSTLAKDEQVALAQSVAGIRQYTQFMALMDNWDVMQKNLETTEAANGALEEQQKIYEESIAAAEKRMSTAGEKLKSTIIGSDELTPLYDFGAGALEVIAEIFEAFGGLETILYGVVAALTKMYQPQLVSFFNNMGTAAGNFWEKTKYFFTLGKKGSANPMQDYKNEALDLNSQMLAHQDGDREGILNSKFSKEQADIQRMLLEYQNKLTDAQKQEFQWRLQILEIQQKQALEAAKTADEAQKAADASKEQSRTGGHMTSQEVETFGAKASNYGKALQSGNNALSIFENIPTDVKTKPTMEQRNEIADSVHGHMSYSGKAYQDMGIKMDANSGLAARLGNEISGMDKEAFSQKMQSVENGGAGLNAYEAALDQIEQEFLEGGQSVETFRQKLEQLNQIMQQYGSSNMEEATRTAFAGAIEDPEANRAFNMANLKDNASIEDINEVLNTETAVDATEMGKATKGAKIEEHTIQAKQELAQAEEEYAKAKENATTIDAKGNKVLDENNKALLEAEKRHEKAKNKVKGLERETKKLGNSVRKHGNELRKDDIATKKANKTTEELRKEAGNATESIDEMTQANIEAGKAEANHDAQTNNLSKSTDKLKGSLKGAATDTGGFAKNLASGISQMATYAMGLNMLSSAFEQIGSSIAKGEGGLSNWISNISSMLMGLGMLIPVIVTASSKIQGLTTAQLINNTASKFGIQLTKQSTAERKKELMEQLKKITGDKAEAASSALAALGNAGKIVAQSWGAAIPIALMALGMVAPILGGIGGFSSGAKEVKQEEVSKGTESLEAIKENQELAESVTDLTEEYNALRNAGESTADVLENMRDKIPELIESYKELAKTMGTHIDTSELEKAYEVFEKTGDTSLLEKAQKNIDDDVNNKKETTAKSTRDTAKDLVLDNASTGVGDGIEGDGQYVFEVEDAEDDAEIFKKNFGKYYKNNTGTGYDEEISFDSSNAGELIDIYNAMLQTRADLENKYTSAQLADLKYYQDLNDEIKEMAENMPDVINAQQILFDTEKEKALEDEQSFNSKIGLDSIGSVEEFEANKDRLIEKIQEETEWTKEQAEAYLEATNAYGGYEEAAKFFEEGGLGFNKDANEKTVKEIKEWFANLPEEDRTIAMTIDYTSVASTEEATAALEEARKKADEAGILQEAENLEVDASTLETYTESLADLNKELDENENSTKQIALNNLKISKGLETLTKSWDDNFEIISRGNKTSLEYAEAIGEVKKSFEEMFGVKPSTEYIEKYSNEINEMVNGNFDNLQKLQDALAEDYIINMDIHQPRDEDYAFSVEQVRNTLTELMDSIDTSITLGEQTEISDKFYNQIQKMLDQGIITEQQLESMFRAKGYELEITGWKEMPGPEKTITRKIYHGDGSKDTETIKENETLRVPIINGDDSKLVAGQVNGVATYTKSTDKRVIDTRSTEKKADKKKDRLKSLEDEKERYHEIDQKLKKVEKDLDKISKAKDRAFGNEKLSLLEEEIDKQNESIKLEEKRLEEAKKYYELDRKELLNNYAVKLDKNGNISNYEELQQQYINKLKANADNEEKYNKINEDYEEFKDITSKYEESLKTVNEQQQAIIDAQYELQDLAMEKIEYIVQIKVDAADDDLALIEFLKQSIEDNEFAAAEKIKLATDETGVIKQKIEANQLGISEVQRQVASGDLSVDAAIEKLREYRDEIIDLNGELAEQRNIIFESLGETFEAYNEELDRATEKMEFLSGTMEHYSNLVDIVGKKALGIDNQTLRDMSKETVNLAKSSYEIAKNNLTANEKILTDLQSDRANLVKTFGENSEEVRLMDEQIRIVQDKIQEGYEAVHEAEQATLEAIANDFKQHVDLIMEEFENAVSGIYNSLDELQSAFDRKKEINDRYLEQYEKTYEINKLNRQINQSLNKTDNLKSQKELRELQSQLLAMNEAGVKVSQRDIEYMQKKYELMLAQQALEDAQNAKSVVRLQRDSEGNYGYVYTADQNNIDSAQQNLEDKLYAMQKYGEESILEIQEQLLAVNREFSEAMSELQANSNLSDEEKKRKQEEILASYTEKMRYWTDEANKQMQYGNEINLKYNTDMATNFNDTIIGQMYPDLQSFEGYYLQATEAMDIASQEFSIAINDYYGQIQTVSGDTKDKLDKDLKKVRDDSAATEKSAKQLATKMQTEMSCASGYVNNFASEYGGYMSNIQSATQATIIEVGNLIDKYEDLIATKKEAAQDYSGQGTGQGPTRPTSPPTIPTSPPSGKKAKWIMNAPYQADGKKNNTMTLNGVQYKQLSDQKYYKVSDLKKAEVKDGKINVYGLQSKNLTDFAKFKKDKKVREFKLDTSDIGTSGSDQWLQKYYVLENGKLVQKDAGTLAWLSHTNLNKNEKGQNLSKLSKSSRLDWIVKKNGGDNTITNIKYQDDKFYYRIADWPGSQLGALWLREDQIIGTFDTGGYTGSWGPEGRMAMLHQKEIVLNAHDTENFLTAIEIVRSIANQMNLNNQKLSEYATSSTRLPKTQAETLQQEVTIHAEFPNATNHNEIEEAFGNLVNLAAQYTNRKF